MPDYEPLSTAAALASLSARVAGQILDTAIAVVPIVAAAGIMQAIEELAIPLLLLAVVWGLYYAYFADSMNEGQGIGKRMVGTRVVDGVRGVPCSARQSFVRNLSLYLLGPLDWIFIFGARRQRLGDMLAGTIVVSS